MATLYYCQFNFTVCVVNIQPPDSQTKHPSEEKQKDPGGVIYVYIIAILSNINTYKDIYNIFFPVCAGTKSKQTCCGSRT